MLKTSIRIYLLANLSLLCGITVFMFPEGMMLGLVAMPFSLIFSAPLILIILICFFLLRTLALRPFVSWSLFLVAIGAMSFLPFYWFDIQMAALHEMRFFVDCGVISAFAAVFFSRNSIHQIFQIPNDEKGNHIDNY